MTEVRNIVGKLVCRIDKAHKSIEIAVKGYVTIVRFDDDGSIQITNLPKVS